jgi:formylglycine-generating enzyme required for sulfatase activity
MALHPSGGIELNNANGDGNKYGLIAGRENLPVIFVSWYDSIRFANWLHNDQGSGDTETGAYTLGALDQFGVPLNGLAIERNAGAKVFLTSENEWYKAAYYDAPAAAYVDYPTGTNNEPNSDQPPGDPAIAANAANFFRDTADVGYNDGFAVTGSPLSDFNQGYLTEVGAYVDSPSLLGTYDQGGNVWEWNESLIDGFFRGFRGGSWDYQSAAMQAAFRNEIDPTFEGFSVGFRVAMVPEPSSGMLAWLAIVGVMRWRRVAARH